MIRWLILVYGCACYALSGVVFAYTVVFLQHMDASSAAGSLDATAVALDLALIALFGVQHSVMARAGFKRWWTKIVPQPIERSTYVLASNAALLLVCVLWQPVAGVVWSVENNLAAGVIVAVALAGLTIMVVGNLQLDHFELFGLRQVWAYFRGQRDTEIPFRIPGLYRFVRHPLMLGLLLALWATPHLSANRLLFNGGMTAYILLALRWEERDLIHRFGAAYAEYRMRVPMLLPWKGRSA